MRDLREPELIGGMSCDQIAAYRVRGRQQASGRDTVAGMLIGLVAIALVSAPAIATEVRPATICDQLGEGIRGVVADGGGELDLQRIAAKAPQLRLDIPEDRPLGSNGTISLDARKFLTAVEIAQIEKSELLQDSYATVRLVGSAPTYLVIEQIGGQLRIKRLEYFERTGTGLDVLGQPPPVTSDLVEYCQTCGADAVPVTISGTPYVVSTAFERPGSGIAGTLTFTATVHSLGRHIAGPSVCSVSASFAHRYERDRNSPPCADPGCGAFDAIEKAIENYDASGSWPPEFGSDPSELVDSTGTPWGPYNNPLDQADLGPNSRCARFYDKAILRRLEYRGRSYLARVGGGECGALEAGDFVAALFEVEDRHLKNLGAVIINRVRTSVIDMRVTGGPTRDPR